MHIVFVFMWLTTSVDNLLCYLTLPITRLTVATRRLNWQATRYWRVVSSDVDCDDDIADIAASCALRHTDVGVQLKQRVRQVVHLDAVFQHFLRVVGLQAAGDRVTDVIERDTDGALSSTGNHSYTYCNIL